MAKIVLMSVKINRIGNLFGATGGSFAGNIYHPEGVCPTINTAGGGMREPMIIEIYNETHGDTDEGAE